MKKALLILGAAAMLLVAGCNQGNQGGTSDQYNSNTNRMRQAPAHTNANQNNSGAGRSGANP